MQDRPASPRTLRLHADDNIIVAVDGLMPGARAYDIEATARVLKGHKMAITKIEKGAPIVKFGQIIGFADADIAPGEHVHTHNCAYAEFDRDYAFAEGAGNEAILPVGQQATFQGYRRASGKAGTRNYIAILTSVNCSASVARFMAEDANRSGLLDEYPNVDGVAAFVHGTGCGMATNSAGFEFLERTQWGMAGHANIAAALIVGLGCEVFQIARMKEKYGLVEGDNLHTMTIQDSGGTRKTIADGVARIREMLPAANAVSRETIPASELMVALQCGGSDGYSGITANPALGVAADMLVHHGGTAVLGETPEIYGAEHLLTRRAANVDIGRKLVDIIEWWQDYTAKHNGSMD
ncbi:MAG: UxaA family hydrolase, partial [Hyphomicrobiaceae bacterium]